MIDITKYLTRIGYEGPRTPTIEVLQGLHLRHMLAVPFENLDIHLGRRIVLDEAAFFNKIVVARRGGFCYELNGLFAALLRQLGFDVTLLSARVMGDDGTFGPDFDHMVLLVHLDEPWLVDVGFGDSFREPLRLQPRFEQLQTYGTYRLLYDGVQWTLQTLLESGAWETNYTFTLQAHTLDEFAPMCDYQQTSPESGFTQRRICSLATSEGRITLSDMRYIVTNGGRRVERVMTGPDEVNRLLTEQFGMGLTVRKIRR